MLKSLPIKLKLALLAGLPVIGAIVLSYLVAADAQRRLDSAKALGSIEDLARLATLMSQTVDAVQDERTASALKLGQGGTLDELKAEREQVTQSFQRLSEFLKHRDMSRLPKRLAEGLDSAQKKYASIELERAGLTKPELSVDDMVGFPKEVNADLVRATAALTGLSDDGVMLRNIQGLVTVLELQERASREAALLSYVFAKGEYPPGGYKVLVNLVSEQQVFEQVFRQSTSQDLVDLFDAKMKDQTIARDRELRKIALETMDDNFGVDAAEWYRVQNQQQQIFRQLSARLNQRVKEAALAKIGEAQNAVALARKVSIGVVVSSLLLALIIGAGVSRSVASLAGAAAEVQAKKDFRIRAKKVSGDELGKLTDAFNEMLQGIQNRDQELEHHRQNLEHLVEERTAELSKRNQAMRLVLDNVEQGLATIRRDGTLESERSRAFDTMFDAKATKFHEALAPENENLQAMLELGWEGLTDEILPPEVSVEQIPSRLERGGRHYDLAYKLIMNDGRFDGALLMATDVTEQVEQRKKEAEQREMIAVFEAVMRDKAGFIEFFNDVERMVQDVVGENIRDMAVSRRVVHTIKGNTAIFGVQSLAEHCHALESACIEEDRLPNEAERDALATVWKAFSDRVKVFSNDSEDVIEVQYTELERLLVAVRAHKAHAELQAMLETLRHEPTAVRFQRMGDQAKRLAKQLGKPDLEIAIQSNDVRLPGDRWSEVWSASVHLLRNALDHGIERAEERTAAGKPAHGTLTFRSRVEGGRFVIELSDDGRGIDWQRVTEKAKGLKLPTATREDLVNALMHDGFSTRDAASEVSGRGVGMGAVRQAVQALNGEIQVISSPGKGTTWRLLVPVAGNDRPSPHSLHPGARPSLRPLPPSQKRHAATS